MRTVKVGMFPGEIKEYAVDDDAKVIDALNLAGITVSNEQTITLDSVNVYADAYIGNGSTILVAKRLKGNIA